MNMCMLRSMKKKESTLETHNMSLVVDWNYDEPWGKVLYTLSRPMAMLPHPSFHTFGLGIRYRLSWPLSMVRIASISHSVNSSITVSLRLERRSNAARIECEGTPPIRIVIVMIKLLLPFWIIVSSAGSEIPPRRHFKNMTRSSCTIDLNFVLGRTSMTLPKTATVFTRPGIPMSKLAFDKIHHLPFPVAVKCVNMGTEHPHFIEVKICTSTATLH